MRIYDVIEKKRDGKELSLEEIDYFIKGYCEGDIKDYQVSALLMAIFINGMNERETTDLTIAMAKSGEMIDLSDIEGIKVDKHSTGGVGDKTTLIVAPIVASCGIPVAKMSGRGLGFTGGTIDKLESIPGFKTTLTKKEFIDFVNLHKIAVVGQAQDIVPADKKLYALRDVTATIDSIPLIASSIMSKKLAAGADKIVLDVKTGKGAFMKDLDKSIELARMMVKIGKLAGREVYAVVTDMNVPLGYAVGNSLEVIEAIETLKGHGPEDLTEICTVLAAKMLELANIGNYEECKNIAKSNIINGAALRKFRDMIYNQGGDTRVIDNYELFYKAGICEIIVADKEGYIDEILSDLVGKTAVILGAGRETKESSIDYSAGILLKKKCGDFVHKGEELAVLYTNEEKKLEIAKDIFRSSIIMSKEKKEKRSLILAYVDSNGHVELV